MSTSAPRAVDRLDRAAAASLEPARILFWIYAGRLAVALGVFGSAVVVGDIWTDRAGELVPTATRVVPLAALVAVALLTPLAYWWSHLRRRPASRTFIGVQAAFDILLVTAVVHLTGGPESVLAPLLYVALVSGYALLLPLGLGVTVALVSGGAYLAEVAVAYPLHLNIIVLAQAGIFTAVASASGLIGGRLREVGQELTSLEGELRRLRLGTADILRALDSGVFTVDGGGRIAYLNPAAAELLALDAKVWIGRDVLTELDLRATGVAEAVRETFRTGRAVRNRDVEIVRSPEGEHRPVAVSTRLLERPDGASLVTAVLQDRRLTRRLEELHLRAGRLEAVAELSASLAHEIKNPLASIRSAVEQLAASASDDEESATLGRLIVRETDRLSRLLSEFNDFARVDVFERRPLDVRRLIEEAVELVRQRPEAQRRATFETRMEEPVDDLWGDPDLIHRTLFNLVLNAVQVADQHDREVRVRIVADTMRPEEVPREITAGVPVRIRVMDDGPGIAPHHMERIFDPFYTRREGGSGMGLAIAHRAIHAHGGALLVTSEPGRGATFVIILPRRDWRERRRLESERESDGAADPRGLVGRVEAGAEVGVPPRAAGSPGGMRDIAEPGTSEAAATAAHVQGGARR